MLLRAARRARWRGRAEKFTPGVRIAFRQTPREWELKPILPMRPASVIMVMLGPEAGWMVRAMMLVCWRMSHCDECQSNDGVGEGNSRPSFARGERWKGSDRIALCIHPWSSFP